MAHSSINFRFLSFFLSFFFFQRRVGASLFTDVSHSAAFTWVPCSLAHSERQIPAMACRAQQAQPETRPEMTRCCQKELLLNVRGFASTQKRDFDAFVEWISLPAHQILAVNSPPTPYTDSNAMTIGAKADRDQSPTVSWFSGWNKTPHNRADCDTGHMTDCPRYRGIWRRKHTMNKRWLTIPTL